MLNGSKMTAIAANNAPTFYVDADRQADCTECFVCSQLAGINKHKYAADWQEILIAVVLKWIFVQERLPCCQYEIHAAQALKETAPL